MTPTTIYKHWLPHLRALIENKQMGFNLPEDDWKKMASLGMVVIEPNGRIATALGVKVLQTADLMDELKSKGIKLSW